MAVKLRYDGKNVFDGWDEDLRQWTIMSHFYDKDGQDRYRSSFMLQGLKELGIIKQ